MTSAAGEAPVFNIPFEHIRSKSFGFNLALNVIRAFRVEGKVPYTL